MAFLVAPLWVPAAAVPFAALMFPYPEQRRWIYITVIIAAVFAYGGVAAFGTPVFLLLRASKRTAFSIAPVLAPRNERRECAGPVPDLPGRGAQREPTLPPCRRRPAGIGESPMDPPECKEIARCRSSATSSAGSCPAPVAG